MSKNLSILEGGRSKTASNVSRLTTSLQGGGICHWVPEDERLLSTKYVNKNGLYLPTEDSVYAFSKMTVNVPGGAAGYDVPTVDESGNPMPSPSSPSYDPEIPTYGPVEVNDGVQPTQIPPIDGGAGSSIVGIDPDTGNLSTASVGKDGKITKMEIPASIRIKVKPSKVNYESGQLIDYGGLVIELLKTDGTTFTDPDYPDGTIRWQMGPFLPPSKDHPHRNYVIDTTVKNAEAKSGEEGTISLVTLSDELSEYFNAPVSMGTLLEFRGQGAYWYKGYHVVGAVAAAFSSNADGDGVTFVSSTDSDGGSYASYLFVKRVDMAALTHLPIKDTVTIDGKTAYWAATAMGGSGPYEAITGTLNVKKKSFDLHEVAPKLAWYMTYGDVVTGATQRIPVTWKSPYDGKTLEASFNIRVTSKQDDGGVGGGGGSGVGGGGGGGGGHSF